MIAAFFSINGYVATVPLEDRKTVTADWYTTICLPEVIDELRKKSEIAASSFITTMRALTQPLKQPNI